MKISATQVACIPSFRLFAFVFELHYLFILPSLSPRFSWLQTMQTRVDPEMHRLDDDESI